MKIGWLINLYHVWTNMFITTNRYHSDTGTPTPVHWPCYQVIGGQLTSCLSLRSGLIASYPKNEVLSYWAVSPPLEPWIYMYIYSQVLVLIWPNQVRRSICKTWRVLGAQLPPLAYIETSCTILLSTWHILYWNSSARPESAISAVLMQSAVSSCSTYRHVSMGYIVLVYYVARASQIEIS